MIRDGRDVAVSMHKEGWIRPLPWDRNQGLLVAASHWLWKVNRGRKCGRRLAPDYLEVRFEDLLAKREETLFLISAFVGYDLNLDHIQKNLLGTLRESNSTFRSTPQQDRPVGRWRTLLSAQEIALLESVLGSTLRELGYEVSQRELETSNVTTRIRKAMYPAYFDARLWCKTNTPLGRFVDTSRLRLERQVS